MDLEKVITIKLNSLPDLVRLATSLSLPQMTSYILKFKHNDKLYLGILGIFRDYYKYYGIPIFYYYVLEGEKAEEVEKSNYIVFSADTETIEFSKTAKPGRSIPLIGLAEKPVFLPDDIYKCCIFLTLT